MQKLQLGCRLNSELCVCKCYELQSDSAGHRRLGTRIFEAKLDRSTINKQEITNNKCKCSNTLKKVQRNNKVRRCEDTSNIVRGDIAETLKFDDIIKNKDFQEN